MNKYALIPVLLLLLLETTGVAETMDVYNARDYGAVADGKTDDTQSIQKALDEAAKKGGTVYLPAGTYLVSASLNIPTGVCLQGTWEMAHHGIWDKNTLLLATRGHGTEEGPSLIEMQPSTAVRGLTILYPNQDPNNIVPYPWTIRGRGMHNTIENLTLVNSYNGITIGPEWNELHLIRNVYGCPLRRGILIDYTTDIGRIENVHFNIHYWSRANHPNGPKGEGATEPYRVWIQNNLEAFIFGRTDWESVKDTFSYGAHTVYKFVDMGRGAMNGSLIGIGADGCIYGMVVEAIQPMGLLITNGQFAAFRNPEMPKQDFDPGSCAIYTKDSFHGNLTFSNCSFWGGNAVAHLRGKSDGHVRFSDCHVRDWAVYSPERPAIDVDGPDIMVRGSTFGTPGKHIAIGPNTKMAIITENIVSGAFSIRKPEKGKYLVERNLSGE